MDTILTPERLAAAFSTLRHHPATSAFQKQIDQAEENLKGASDLPSAFEQISGPAKALLRLELSGFFEKDAHQLVTIPRIPATDLGDPPSMESYFESGKLPSVEEAIAMIESADFDLVRESQVMSSPVEPKNIAPDNTSTFLFISDAQPQSETNTRITNISQMNAILNNFGTNTWPTGFKLSCENTPVGQFSSVFFGGDICQVGGGYNFFDQMFNHPATYIGGWGLETISKLLQTGNISGHGPTRLNYRPTYFGLGNHDINSDGTPHVGWSKGSGRWSRPSDYWRWQMWNFICQMHTGSQSPDALFPVTSADCDGKGDFSWREWSFNYKVNLGPVDVYQMHRYGGDSEWGRADGILWLMRELQAGGTDRPVIIVQHYCFERFVVTPFWTVDEENAFLEILKPYNVIGLLTGHVHNVPGSTPYRVPLPNSTGTFDEFRPGSCGDHGAFAMVRATRLTLDVMQGQTENNTLVWKCGYSKNLGWQMDQTDQYFVLPSTNGTSLMIQNHDGGSTKFLVGINVTNSNSLKVSWDIQNQIPSTQPWIMDSNDKYYVLNNNLILVQSKYAGTPWVTLAAYNSSGLISQWSISNKYGSWQMDQGDKYYVLSNNLLLVQSTYAGTPWVGLVSTVGSEFTVPWAAGTVYDIWRMDQCDNYYVLDNTTLLVQSTYAGTRWIGLASYSTSGLTIQWSANTAYGSWQMDQGDKYYALGHNLVLVQSTYAGTPWVGVAAYSTSGLTMQWSSGNVYGDWQMDQGDRYYVLGNNLLLVQSTNGVARIGLVTTVGSELTVVWTAQGSYGGWVMDTGDQYYLLGNNQLLVQSTYGGSNRYASLISYSNSGLTVQGGAQNIIPPSQQTQDA